MLIYAITLTIVLHSSIVKCDNVLLYSKENFSVNIDKNNNFIMFFAPWCSYCKGFAPIWENLAQDFNNEKSGLAIAKVDCTQQTELCSDQDITGYPTLKIYKIGQHEGTKFKGTRDLSTLKRFINDEIGLAEQVSSESEMVGTVLELTEDMFEEHVSDGNHFVKFYAPWCGHCQTLAPTWQKLADKLSQNEDVSVSKVDCTENQQLCSALEIVSYPTLLWIQGGKRLNIYRGSRSLSDLEAYVIEMIHPTESTDPADDALDPGKSVISLNDDNFHFHIDSGYTFVKFFAPWCGHCKRLAPTWEELAQKLSDERKIKIANVDCTIEENKELCKEQEVEGYPTLFFYRNGVKVTEYNGSRVLEDLLEFVKRHTAHDEL